MGGGFGTAGGEFGGADEDGAQLFDPGEEVVFRGGRPPMATGPEVDFRGRRVGAHHVVREWVSGHAAPPGPPSWATGGRPVVPGRSPRGACARPPGRGVARRRPR